MATSAEIRQQRVAARRHEQLSQPPSAWHRSGFLVPHLFQQEAEHQSDDPLTFFD